MLEWEITPSWSVMRPNTNLSLLLSGSVGQTSFYIILHHFKYLKYFIQGGEQNFTERLSAKSFLKTTLGCEPVLIVNYMRTGSS